MAKKSRRRMPNHIVLPNGMWRFIKGKSRTRTLKPQRLRPKTRRIKGMTRRRHSRRAYSRSRPFGGGKLMTGIYPLRGPIGSAIMGAGISSLQEKALPQMIPYQGPAAGFIVGGVYGAAGAFIRDMLKGGTTNAGGGW